MVLGVNSSDVKLDWQFSGAPQNYLVQIFKQKPGGTLEQITASKDGNAFIPSNTKDFVASLDAQLKLKNVGKDDEYTYSIILSNSVPAQEDSHAVSIIVVGKWWVTLLHFVLWYISCVFITVYVSNLVVSNGNVPISERSWRKLYI